MIEFIANQPEMRGLQMLISNIFAVPKQFLLAFQIWSFELLSPLHELKGHKGCVRCSVFSMDSTLLATGDDNGEIRVGQLGQALCTTVGTFVKVTRKHRPWGPCWMRRSLLCFSCTCSQLRSTAEKNSFQSSSEEFPVYGREQMPQLFAVGSLL